MLSEIIFYTLYQSLETWCLLTQIIVVHYYFFSSSCLLSESFAFKKFL